MAHSSVNPVLSRPCPVRWAGFESDTYRLQQAGWNIAVEQEIREERIRLLIRHRGMRLYAVSEYNPFNYYSSAQADMPIFNVVQALPENTQIRIMNMDFSRFEEVDAKPQMNMRETITCLEDYKIFAAPLVRTEEIIVEPQDVATMLEQIRKMQSPEQAAIRARQQAADKRGQVSERQMFHAQILSFARAA